LKAELLSHQSAEVVVNLAGIVGDTGYQTSRAFNGFPKHVMVRLVRLHSFV
jgi:hypothetical protein